MDPKREVWRCVKDRLPNATEQDFLDAWRYYELQTEIIVSYLEALETYFIAEGDRWRPRAYRNARIAISKHPYPIASGFQAQKIPGIGKSISAKIDEILKGGKLDYMDSKTQKLVDELEEIKKHSQQLPVVRNFVSQTTSRVVSTGLKKIATRTAILVKSIFMNEWYSVIPRDAPNRFAITGNYRRGVEDDKVELLLALKLSKKDVLNYLAQFVFLLESKHNAELKKIGDLSYKGEMPVRNEMISVTITLVPYDTWGTHLIYSTGPRKFIEDLEARAESLGYSLTEDGMEHNFEDIFSATEMAVFNSLNMNYVDPVDR